MSKKIRVLHIVKWFYAGGAERLLSSILEHSDKEKYEHLVLSLSDQGERLADIEKNLDIPYKAIDISRDKNNLINYIKCFRYIKRIKPDIIKTWLPPANKIGGVIGKLLRIPVIWGIHNAQFPTSYEKKLFSRSKFFAKKIVACSKPVYDTCINANCNPKFLHIITNGTDTDRFKFNSDAKKLISHELGIDEKSLIIGIAAEYTPIKRYEIFLKAAQIFFASHPDTHFILCGKWTDKGNTGLQLYTEFLNMPNNIHLLGIRNDMADIFSAMDINSLISSNESFGLSITEAMACKTLCVATNVGIMSKLLKDVGEIIPVSDNPDILAKAWERLLDLSEQEKTERLELGRNRIVNQYSIIETAKKYDEIYSCVYNNINQA